VIAFALAAVLLALGVLAAVLLPLLRGGGAAPAREAFDRAVYRDQIAELEREAARGLIAPAEAGTARLEIQRRLLRATGGPGEARAGRNPALALVLALLAASGAGLVYVSTGSPGVPGQPLAARATDPEEEALRQGLVQLERRVEETPQDGEAWLLLARTRGALAKWRAADEAWRRALALLPPTPDLRAGALEARVLAGDGIVTPEAVAGFTQILAEESDNPVARFYLAAAAAQAGRNQEAITAWLALAGDLPAGFGIRDEIARRVAAAARAAGIATPALPPPAEPPSAEARQAMIRGMVERLAARLEAEPDDAEGWQRLGRAWGVLGERGKSAAAYARAGALRPDDMALALAEAETLLEGLPATAPFPPRARELLGRVIAADPKQPAALWHLGVEAAKRGAMAEAVGLWERLLEVLPGDGEDARLVRSAIEAVKRR
jgi:cytochrome c-type biogenesis protein CcmH